MTLTVKVKDIEIANNKKLVLIAGPCAIESKNHALWMANEIKNICDAIGMNFIYKSSFDKANRTSGSSARGIGIHAAAEIFTEIRNTFNIPCITDVHEPWQCDFIRNYVDILQIPAFLCRQTDLLMAAARTGLPVNVKKGQFLAPWDMINVAKKIGSFGNNQVILCERGASFGYNTLVSDMRSLEIMKQTGYPVMFDATHSVQQPGGLGETSGGQREFVPVLARAAVAVGVSSVFIETHENPDNAPSDGPNMVPLNDLKDLLSTLLEIDALIKAKGL